MSSVTTPESSESDPACSKPDQMATEQDLRCHSAGDWCLANAVQTSLRCINATVRETAEQLGLCPVLWSVDSLDWERPGVTTLVSNVLKNAKSGSIVLMHDGGGDRSETVQALPHIISGLRTVSSLSQSSSKGRSRSEEAFSCPCSCRYVVDLGVLFALEERSIVLLVSMRPRGVSQPQKGLQERRPVRRQQRIGSIHWSGS